MDAFFQQFKNLRSGVIMRDGRVSTWTIREHRNDPIVFLEKLMISSMNSLTDDSEWQAAVHKDEDLSEKLLQCARMLPFSDYGGPKYGFTQPSGTPHILFTSEMLKHVRTVHKQCVDHSHYDADNIGRSVHPGVARLRRASTASWVPTRARCWQKYNSEI
jgi:hypothetical protein